MAIAICPPAANSCVVRGDHDERSQTLALVFK